MLLSTKDRQILEHIIEYCREVQLGLMEFHSDKTLCMQNAVFRNACAMPIMQIGELSKKLSDDIQDSHREIPWRAIKGMRDIFAHDYHSMNKDMIWGTSTNNIPALSVELEKILKEE